MGFRVQGLGFQPVFAEEVEPAVIGERESDVEPPVQVLARRERHLRVEGLGFRVWGLGLKVEG